MDKILFKELKPILNYHPIKMGNTEVVLSEYKNKTLCRLLQNNIQWMAFDYPNENYLCEEFIEINLAHGKIVTTGLGFGIRETLLSRKKEIDEIVVFEKNIDVIKLFEFFTKKSNFDTSKIKIIHEDASNAVNIECDWLLLDHYEIDYLTHWEIVDNIREMSIKSVAKNVFFWPFVIYYKAFCYKKRISFDMKSSYRRFVEEIKIQKMPEIGEDLLKYCNQFDTIKFS